MQDFQHSKDVGARRMGDMIQLTANINPKGRTGEELQRDLIHQLQVQNEQLRRIIDDLYREIAEIKKKG